jgi:hypothetical protein
MKDEKDKRTFKQFFYSLFIKDFDRKLESAKKTHKMIVASTNGRLNHFYNKKGEQIRGYYKRPAKFSNVLPTNPLILKYER